MKAKEKKSEETPSIYSLSYICKHHSYYLQDHAPTENELKYNQKLVQMQAVFKESFFLRCLQLYKITKQMH